MSKFQFQAALWVSIWVSWMDVGCVAQESAVPPAAGKGQSSTQVDQAIRSILDVAKGSVAAAQDEQVAVMKAQQALEAIRLVGQLGDINTDSYADQLMDEWRSRPALLDVLVRSRFEVALRQWQQLDKSQWAAALSSFVSGAKKVEISPAYSEMLIRTAYMQDMLDNGDQSRLVTNAIRALLPQFKAFDSKQEAAANGRKVKLLAPRLEGVARRFELPGNPLELDGKLLDGKPFDWKSYRGKVVLVDFHASFCGPCREEVPNVLANYQAYHDKGFEVVGVNIDSDPQSAEKYQQETGAVFPTIFSDDPQANGWNSPLAVKYGVTGIPRVILVDKEGKVVSTSARGPRLGQLLEKLLGPVGGGENKNSGIPVRRPNAG